jgi:hypothetical protein
MLPHLLLGLLLVLGFAGRPWWVVLVAAAALTIASFEYVQRRASHGQTADNSSYLQAIAHNAGDSLAYSSLAYVVGWLMASIVGLA